jgi:hypothetical protein
VGIEAATAVGRGSFGELQDTGSGRVCRFGPHPAEALAGVFAAGARLDGRRWSDLVRDLAATGPARRCARQSTAFAVIGTPERGTAYLELDGCRRILAGGGLRQAPPDLVARVEALTP